MDAPSQADVQWLRSLRVTERARFLTRLAHNLTVAGSALVLTSRSADARLEQLRQLNEIQHRLSSYISDALGSDEDLEWLPIVVKYVLEQPDAELRKAAIWAWTHTRGSFVCRPLTIVGGVRDALAAWRLGR